MTPNSDNTRLPGSRLLHRIDQLASRPAIAVAVVVADGLWVIYSSVIGFPNRLETVFQTLVAALTLAMVFVIQHTQSRQQVATQRKLDEILHALPRASNRLIALEDGSDEALGTAQQAHRELRRQAVRTSHPDTEDSGAAPN
ncbi:low affinity iron permease family protein [Jatrophihabitans telluris]|uniref:Low affinity iron permease family protein n=1 Tax=Jatrophihabitans telluris TaxID=2038343 RepID=A0ABY4R0L6_9ACTN|nr:low affinity iron permease family protein [Jatrophihabitans telluris]UQX88666.1 low affinity iron permease family protein [Jatrophihabitans telluris]